MGSVKLDNRRFSVFASFSSQVWSELAPQLFPEIILAIGSFNLQYLKNLHSLPDHCLLSGGAATQGYQFILSPLAD